MDKELANNQEINFKNRFRAMLSRAKMSSIIAFCLFDSECVEESLQDYELRLNKSQLKFLDKIESLYPNVNRDDDKFFEIYSDAIVENEEIMFEIGLLIGLVLHEDINKKFSCLQKSVGSQITDWWLKEI